MPVFFRIAGLPFGLVSSTSRKACPLLRAPLRFALLLIAFHAAADSWRSLCVNRRLFPRYTSLSPFKDLYSIFLPLISHRGTSTLVAYRKILVHGFWKLSLHRIICNQECLPEMKPSRVILLILNITLIHCGEPPNIYRWMSDNAYICR